MLQSLLTGSAGSSQPATGRVDLVCFVYLVDLVPLVSFVQPNKLNKPNKPNNGLFRILLIPHFEHQIEAISHEEDVCHPAGNQRRQHPTAAERDRD